MPQFLAYFHTYLTGLGRTLSSGIEYIQYLLVGSGGVARAQIPDMFNTSLQALVGS